MNFHIISKSVTLVWSTAYMSTDNPDDKICFCYNISRSTIEKAIREGAKTIEEIRKQTQANTGCGGCEQEVRQILEKILKENTSR
jgi:NAD(P)H-nitrite reductase large subunit